MFLCPDVIYKHLSESSQQTPRSFGEIIYILHENSLNVECSFLLDLFLRMHHNFTRCLRSCHEPKTNEFSSLKSTHRLCN